MKKILIIILTLSSTLSYSQNKLENQIFKKIIDFQIEIGNKGIYIQCEKLKTFFNFKKINEETGLKVSLNILKELDQNAKKSNDGIWESKLLTELNYSIDFLKSKKCLTKKDIKQLFKKTKKRQSIISISKPVFDHNYKNCIVSISYSKFTGNFYGHSYFLSKVYGIWTIVAVFETWMT